MNHKLLTADQLHAIRVRFSAVEFYPYPGCDNDVNELLAHIAAIESELKKRPVKIEIVHSNTDSWQRELREAYIQSTRIKLKLTEDTGRVFTLEPSLVVDILRDPKMT